MLNVNPFEISELQQIWIIGDFPLKMKEVAAPM
jgi:hypothetical protein